MKLNDFFDHIYCMTMHRHSERYKELNKYFIDHDITVEKVYGYDGSRTTFPLTKSVESLRKGHSDLKSVKITPQEAAIVFNNKSILMDAIANGYENILILEDDAVFADNFEEEFTKVIEELPENWDLFYLGGLFYWNMPRPWKDHLWIAERVLGLHAVGINHTVYETLLNSTNLTEPADVTYGKIQPILESFISKKTLIGQRSGLISSLTEEEVRIEPFAWDGAVERRWRKNVSRP
jgi:Glycosyltransferase family 25 (LPS biosynthesis protein)